MRIPKKLKVHGKNFDTVYMKNVKNEKGEGLFGCTDLNNCKIYFEKGMNPERKREVVLHEGLHVIDRDMALGLGEGKVNVLSLEILAFIRNNKLDFLN